VPLIRYVSHPPAPMSPRYVDLHAHFLPGLDDGAKTREEGLLMVDALTALGFSTLHATPHQRAGMFMPSRPDIDEAFAAVAGEVRESRPGIEVGLAAENFWDEVFHARLRDHSVPTYPGGRAFLFEINPQLAPPRLEQVLFEIRLSGLLPVMAHPERYLVVQNDLGRAEAFGRTAAMLVDVGALDGAHGRAPMKTARRLMEEGLAHAVASDVHTAEDQRAVAAGMAWIRKRLGAPTLDRLLDDNPRQVLAGELPDRT
jgi:protein-tyrosine phosphatase